MNTEHPGNLCYVGYKVKPRQVHCHLYSILTFEVPSEKNNRPLMRDGKIVFVSDRSLFPKVFDDADDTMKSLWPPDPARSGFYDIYKIMYLIEKKDFDDCGLIIGCFNDTEDMLLALGLYYPGEYRASVIKFLSHLTFHKEYGSFFKETGIPRSLIKECLLWMFKRIREQAVYLNPFGWNTADPWKPLL